MEILSKLWVAITTENETIVDIMSIFLLLIEMPLTLEFFLAVLRIPATLKQKRIYMVITVPIGLLCIFLIPKPYSNIITMIITPFIIMRVFKTSFFKALFAEFLPIICITFLELILTRLFLILFKIDYGGCANIPIYRLSILTCIYLVLFLFYKLFKKEGIHINFFDTINRRNKFILIFNVIIAMVVLFSQIYLIVFYNDRLPNFIIYINIIALVAYFVISIYSMIKTMSL